MTPMKLEEIVQGVIVLCQNMNERLNIIEKQLGIKNTIEGFSCQKCGSSYKGIDYNNFICPACGCSTFDPIMKTDIKGEFDDGSFMVEDK